jgi:hypothetical protein
MIRAVHGDLVIEARDMTILYDGNGKSGVCTANVGNHDFLGH